MAPHVAAPIPAESTTQTAGAVTVTAIAVMASITEAAAKVMVAKMITTTMADAASKRAAGNPATSEDKEDCNNNCGGARH